LIDADISVMATKAAAETIFYWAITTDINYIVSLIILLKQILLAVDPISKSDKIITIATCV
jgi:hypothetical protein